MAQQNMHYFLNFYLIVESDDVKKNFDTKIQEALYIKKTHPKLNKQLYAHGASFLLNIF